MEKGVYYLIGIEIQTGKMRKFWTWMVVNMAHHVNIVNPPQFAHLNMVNFMLCIVSLLCLHAQLCPTLCDPMDCSWPDSSVHGVLQARILEWVATSSSKGSS